MLKRRVQSVEVAHSSSSTSSTCEAPTDCRSRGSSSDSLIVNAVMKTRVEIGELVDSVQNVADQLLEKNPRRHPDLASQLPGDRTGQVRDIPVITQTLDTLRAAGVLAIDIANFAADQPSRSRVNAGSRICTARGLSNRGSVWKST